MNVYEGKDIRNIALVGHQGSGKTLLTEAMLYEAGVINRMGSIEEGNTLSDYHPNEIERQMSIFTSILHAEWKGCKFNIVDTPGYPDFVGEVITGLKASDLAIFVLNAMEGIQVGTELAWRYGEMTETPCMFVLNHLDHSEMKTDEVFAQMQERFGRGATVVQFPAGAGTRAIIDVLLMKQITFVEGSREYEMGDIEAEYKDRAEELHNTLVENIAENDESLMELYFDKGTLSEDEMRKGLHDAMIRRELFPVFLTSAKENIGVGRFMDFIKNAFPAPTDMPPARTTSGERVKGDPDGPPVALVYRTMAEQHVGEYSFFRLYSGSLETGMDLENAQTGSMERIGQIFSINGRQREQVQRMVVGDLGALVKLKNTHTNDTLRQKGLDVVIEPIEFPEPRYRMAVRATKSGEEDKLAQGLNQVTKEDPSLQVIHDAHLNQLILAGQGELHLEIARSRLKSRFGVEVEFIKPRVSYRETATNTGRASYRHKKQTGGAGQFADISMIVETLEKPLDTSEGISVRNTAVVDMPWGSKIEFVDAIVGGVIDMRRFFGAIQKGVGEALQEGPIAGYPVGDVRIVIYDGGMHAVDSNENAFRAASKMCFRAAFREASPVILEPIFELEVTIPEAFMGEVLSDITSRRGRVQGMEADGVFQVIKALVPEAELHQYSTALRSLTQGRGLHRATFHHYEPMPRHVQDKLAQEAAELQEA